MRKKENGENSVAREVWMCDVRGKESNDYSPTSKYREHGVKLSAVAGPRRHNCSTILNKLDLNVAPDAT